MKKTIKNVSMAIGNGYGHYIITGNVNGTEVKAETTDSEAFDWLNDESSPELHMQSIEHCTNKLVLAYEKQLKYCLQSFVSGKYLVNSHGEKGWKVSNGDDYENQDDFINDIITFSSEDEAELYKNTNEMFAMDVV